MITISPDNFFLKSVGIIKLVHQVIADYHQVIAD